MAETSLFDHSESASSSDVAACEAHNVQPRPACQDEAVRAWRDLRSGAAIAPFDPSAIEVEKPRRFFRFKAAGTDGSDVIAARLRHGRARIEQVVYERLLPKLNLPAPRYYGTVAADDVRYNWLFVDDVGGETYQPDDPECRIAAARWLAALHRGAAAAESELRDIGLPEHGERFYREHLRASLTLLKQYPHDPEIRSQLSREDLGLIQCLLDACAAAETHWEEVCSVVAVAPRTVIHGDAAPRNFRVRRDRMPVTVLCFDWEDAAWAPPVLDLIQAEPGATCDAINPDVDVYLEETRSLWPSLDREKVRRLGVVGRLFWHLLALRLDAEEISSHRLESRLTNFRLYADGLVEVFRELGWRRPACHFDPGGGR